MNAKPGVGLLALAYLGFVAIGLPDGLLGVAVPSIRAFFDLAIDQVGALLLSFMLGYLLSSFASGWVLARMSVTGLLAASCAATGVSLAGYSLTPWWSLMVALGFVAGLGAGAIDAGINTWIATHFGARMLNWCHAAYGVGAASGPILMTHVLAAGLPWQRGYAIVAGGQLLLGAAFGWVALRPSAGSPIATRANDTDPPVALLETLRLPASWLGIAIFFVYTGTELATGLWTYSLFTEARGISPMTAGTWIGIYWASLTIGRIAGGVLAEWMPVATLLRGCIAGGALGAGILTLDLGEIPSFLGLALCGLSFAPIFPSLIATTPARLGSAHAANGVGFQVAGAVLGQSLVPWFLGVLAARTHLAIIAPALFAAVGVLFVTHELLIATATPRALEFRAPSTALQIGQPSAPSSSASPTLGEAGAKQRVSGSRQSVPATDS